MTLGAEGRSASARFWEDARVDPLLAELVRDTYMDADVEAAAARFAASAEFAETWRLITRSVPAPSVLVDLGAGNGIATAAFLGKGIPRVYAIEPDPDDLVGAGAIRRLASADRCTIVTAFGERVPLADGASDVVYARQVLHHAQDLDAMLLECARMLRPGGIFLSARDHVADSPAELDVFLASHPVHRAVGGENAYPLSAYVQAVRGAGLRIELTLGPFDSVINSYPDVASQRELDELPAVLLQRKFGPAGRFAASLAPLRSAARRRLRRTRWPGMPVSILAVKP